MKGIRLSPENSEHIKIKAKQFIGAHQERPDMSKLMLSILSELDISGNTDDALKDKVSETYQLHDAVKNNQLVAIKPLLDSGINVNGKNEIGKTPFFMIAFFRMQEFRCHYTLDCRWS